MAKKRETVPPPAAQMVETIVVLQNRGTANTVRMGARPDRLSEKVAMVYADAAIRYSPLIVRGAPLGEWGDEWVYVELPDSGLKGYIHSAYLVLPQVIPPPVVETEEAETPPPTEE